MKAVFCFFYYIPRKLVHHCDRESSYGLAGVCWNDPIRYEAETSSVPSVHRRRFDSIHQKFRTTFVSIALEGRRSRLASTFLAVIRKVLNGLAAQLYSRS